MKWKEAYRIGHRHGVDFKVKFSHLGGLFKTRTSCDLVKQIKEDKSSRICIVRAGTNHILYILSEKEKKYYAEQILANLGISMN